MTAIIEKMVDMSSENARLLKNINKFADICIAEDRKLLKELAKH